MNEQIFSGRNGATIRYSDAEQYAARLAALRQAGYREIAANEIAGNRFTRLDDGERMVHLACLPALGRTEEIVEPHCDYTTFTPEKKLVPAAIFASSISDRTYFMRLTDNSVVIIDGGWRIEDWMDFDRKWLMQGLVDELRAVTGGESVRVAAWFITHPHFDHCNFIENLQAFGLAGTLQIERIVRNFADEQYVPKSRWFHKDIAACIGSDEQYVDTVEAALGRFGCQLITARAGMKLSLCGMDFEILTTPDESLPDQLPSLNATSLVIRQSYAGQRIIWTGDMSDAMGRIALALYGDALRCDAVQISHHGWGGAGDYAFYEACGAAMQLWTNSEYGFRFFDKNQGYGKTKVATAVYDMPCCKRHIFCNRIKMEELALPIQAGDLFER